MMPAARSNLIFWSRQKGKYFFKTTKKQQNSLKSGNWVFTEISKILNEQFIKMVGKSEQKQYPFESSKLSTIFMHRC